MSPAAVAAQAVADLERAVAAHPNLEVRNLRRLTTNLHSHTAAVCTVLTALARAFADRMVLALVEAEVLGRGARARPEDLVLWVEGAGVFVVEVKSHTIAGIRSFENNVPRVTYGGAADEDTDLLDQPRTFAYDHLKGPLEKAFDAAGQDVPPLYFAGWLPNVAPAEVAVLGARVAPDRVWLSDMLIRDTFLARLSELKNITKGRNTDRAALEHFCPLFGVTSGLRPAAPPRTVPVASMGHAIDRLHQGLKALTREQEALAFDPRLTRGPKVIRGVAGSGKTIVLANAVADALIRDGCRRAEPDLYGPRAAPVQVLVLCFNRVLARHLADLIRACFEARKPRTDWELPLDQVVVRNIDRYAGSLAYAGDIPWDDDPAKTAAALVASPRLADRGRFDHVFIDEGQDLDSGWYPLVRAVVKPDGGDGPSVVVFYDDAQNVYGRKRPGTGVEPAWRDLLGAVPNPRGLATVMRVGHRNTNPILTLSYNLLLGAAADHDPQMATFAGLAEYEGHPIPDDPALAHPHAGRPCVERVGDRRFRVNFALRDGPAPDLRVCPSEDALADGVARELRRLTGPAPCHIQPPDILVLAPSKPAVERVLLACARHGVPAHCPVPLDARQRLKGDPRDAELFQPGKVTVSTTRMAKGFSAAVCLVTSVHELDARQWSKEAAQRARAELHVACTRATLYLQLWGLAGGLMGEADALLKAGLPDRPRPGRRSGG
jgi:hypothetical protein